jgi:hypothetical protein
MHRLSWFVPALLLFCAVAADAERITLDLASLSSWKELTFPWQPRHSSYKSLTVSGRPQIRIESDNASSGLEYLRSFQTYATPILTWSWKAMNILAKGNAETKAGDDYPVRVYVMFPYDASHLSGADRLRYGFIKGLLGYYPPSEILNYVWANRPHARDPIQSAFSDRGFIFLLDEGSTHLGEWRTHEVNIVDDYKAVFRSDPPPTFTLAVMGDTDNTHGRTTAYIRDISLQSPP